MKKWFKCKRLGIMVCNTEQDMNYSDAKKSLKKGEWLIEDWEACLVFRTMYKELNLVKYKNYWNNDINGLGRLSYLISFYGNSNFDAVNRSIDFNDGVRGVIICKKAKEE